MRFVLELHLKRHLPKNVGISTYANIQRQRHKAHRKFAISNAFENRYMRKREKRQRRPSCDLMERNGQNALAHRESNTALLHAKKQLVEVRQDRPAFLKPARIFQRKLKLALRAIGWKDRVFYRAKM